MTARLLAFDTSTEQLAIAVAGPAGERTLLLPGGAQASAALLPAVHRLLAEAGLRLQDLDAIAFGQGPGAFTGLRTSCAVAQGLGFGLDRPLLPLDSLLLVAEDARAQHPGDDDVVVVMDARMDEIYGGRYRWDGSRWQVLAAPALYTLPAAGGAVGRRRAGAGGGFGAGRLRRPPGPAGRPARVRARTRARRGAAAAGAARPRRRGRHRRRTGPAAVPARQDRPDHGRARGRACRQGVSPMSAQLAPAPVLRPMHARDVDAVMVVEAGAYSFPWSRGNFIDSLAAGYEALVLDDAEAGIVGYFVAMTGVDELHLLNVTVATCLAGPRSRQQPAAGAAGARPQLGLATLWLEVRESNQRARALYARLGFAEVGRRRGYYPAPHATREDAIVMRLQLLPPADHAVD